MSLHSLYGIFWCPSSWCPEILECLWTPFSSSSDTKEEKRKQNETKRSVLKWHFVYDTELFFIFKFLFNLIFLQFLLLY